MGGLLIEAVAMKYLQTRALQREEDPPALAALVVVASPRAGSGWAPPLLGRMIPEVDMLKRLTSRDADVDEFFSTHVERRNVAAAQSGHVVLPVYAALGGSDRLVSRFSGAFGVPIEQRLYLEASHKSIVKPDQKDAQLVGWLQRDVVSGRLEVRAQAARERQHSAHRTPAAAAPARPAVVTQFLSDPSGLPWEEVYNEARRAANTTAVAIHDARDVPRAEVDLIIAVHNADLVLAANPAVRATVLQARAERDQRSSLSVGICPVGANFRAAETTVHQLLAEWPPTTSIYVTGAPDAAGVRGVLARLLQLVIGRDPRREVRAALVDQELDEPNDVYGDPGRGGYQ